MLERSRRVKVPKTEAHRDRTDALIEESHIIKEGQGP